MHGATIAEMSTCFVSGSELPSSKDDGLDANSNPGSAEYRSQNGLLTVIRSTRLKALGRSLK